MPIQPISSANLNTRLPSAPATGPELPTPKPPASALSADSIVFTAAGRARREALLRAEEQSPAFDAAEFEAAWKEEIKPALAKWPGRDTSAVAIQQIRYADLLAGGRESENIFERDPGQLMPPGGLPQRPLVDPLTGESRLALREARIRVSAGRYDMIVSVDGEGKLSFEKLFLDGKNVTRQAGDFVKDKLKESPMVWGPVALAGAVGVVALAHNQAAKTGKPVGFDAAKVTVYKSESLEVKAKLRAELTGDKQFVRAAGAEIGTTYHDGPLMAGAGVRYERSSRSYSAVANMGYQVDRDSTFSAAASYDQKTKAYGVGVQYQSSF